MQHHCTTNLKITQISRFSKKYFFNQSRFSISLRVTFVMTLKLLFEHFFADFDLKWLFEL